MCNQEIISNIEKNNFLGVINFNQSIVNMSDFRNYLGNFLTDDTAIISLYNERNRVVLDEMLKFKGQKNYYGVRVQDYIGKNGELNFELIDPILYELVISHSSSIIFMNIDDAWNNTDEKVQDFYNKIKKILSDIGEEYNIKIIFRYIVEDLNTSYLKGMLLNHDKFIVENNSRLEIVTSRDLLNRSINFIKHYDKVESTYYNNITRNDYLKTMGELTEGIVHDVNNMFATISGCLEMINRLGYSKDIEKYMNMINDISIEGSSMINGIMGHIKGSYSYLIDSYNLNDIVNFCIDMTRYRCKKMNREIKIDFDIDLKSEAIIEVDDYQIKQGILNIIFNGIDAIGYEGMLSIKTFDKLDKAYLIIEDNGIGMSDELKGKIFEPYFTTKGEDGLGIGLNIVSRVFDAFGIDIRIESEKGIGSKFIIIFDKK